MSVGRQPWRPRLPAPGASPRPWRAPRPEAGAPRARGCPSGALRPGNRGALLLLSVVLLTLLAPERSWCGPAGVALLCARVAGLSPRQRALCRASPDAMVAIGSGLRLALQECQHQFRHERWNCSAPPHANAMPLVIRVASREAAFGLAVQAAAISWAATSACARGELAGCSCARKAPGGPGPVPAGPHHANNALGPFAEPAAAFRWGGCSSDVEYGAKLSRTFTDAAHQPASAPNSVLAPRLLMDSHNSKAGRKAVKLTLQTDCKCHGVSGSCSVRTCWTSLAQFRVVGDHLMARYRAAWPAVALPVPAARARRHPVELRLAVRHGHGAGHGAGLGRNSRTAVQQGLHAARLPRRTDLVFLQVSPNYCDRDIALGSLGTAGRACNRTSRGADGCGAMCCGRGYNTRQVTSSRQCHCKFHWCCYVHCDVCTDRYEEYTCK